MMKAAHTQQATHTASWIGRSRTATECLLPEGDPFHRTCLLVADLVIHWLLDLRQSITLGCVLH